MTYAEWSTDYVTKRSNLITELAKQDYNIEQIINYFDFDNMVANQPTYCGLYASSTKCHNIDKLNCFFCGCPHFTYKDEGTIQPNGRTLYSSCNINAIKGSEFITDGAVHQDCSNCEIPHRPNFAHINAPKVIKELL